MKRTSKALALLLALVMIFSCIGVQALAATAENVIQVSRDGGYLAIGDSISAGMCCDANVNKEYVGVYNNFEGSCVSQIADALGCTYNHQRIIDKTNNFWSCTYGGMTTTVFADLYGIEDNFTDSYDLYAPMLADYGYEGSAVGANGEAYNGITNVGSIVDIVKKAEVITLELGMCDVFYRPLVVCSGGGSIAGGFELELSAELVTSVMNEVLASYNRFVKLYPEIIRAIKADNPDVTLVLVGAYNLVQDTSIGDMLLPYGNILSNISNEMNKNYKQWAEDFGCLYADSSNTEDYCGEQGMAILDDEYLSNIGRATHPSQNGHDYIARQILSVLPEATPSENKWASTDIVVDLGRFNRVDRVYVDGVEYSYGTGLGCYEMDGYNIVCHYGIGYATTLRVQIVEDGKTAVQIYSLSYQNGAYAAQRVYGDDDTEETNSRFAAFFRGIFQKIADFFENLFK